MSSIQTTTTVSATTTTAPTTTLRNCRSEPARQIFIETNAVTLSAALAATLVCADEVVVASGSPHELMVAGEFAASIDAPLLIIDAASTEIRGELRRLDPTSITVIGDLLPGGVPPGTPTNSLSVAEATAAISGNAADDVDRSDNLWLADATRPDLVAPVTAIAGLRGDRVVLADPHNVLGDQALLEEVRSTSANTVFVAGGFDPLIVEWQSAALLSAPELPGGGLKLFPGRRLVALYGNPLTSALGVMGEQGPEEAVARAAEVAAGYDADGVPVVLSFELIATVASAFSGDDNNYSAEMTIEVIRPWIDVAAANNVYVILDLQPGRTDFLTQAKLYEELLVLPHVGLALDPEWRLEPDQVHLRQIGSVDAAEINQVSEWLAALVRDNTLPQKMFLLHQFRLDMIENRAQVLTHPELATVIQMDGQGPLGTKYETWAALTAGTENLGVFWGWKNFYDEDTPRGGATPAEVLALDPLPVYVSYQ
ncbi:MAG: hypothetical protein ACR2ME_08975 [Acidimicrobiia bacterium]